MNGLISYGNACLFPLPHRGRVTGLLRGLERDASVRLGSEAAADWLQEASVLLWSLQQRLERLPEDARVPYARTCLRKRYLAFLRREERSRVERPFSRFPPGAIDGWEDHACRTDRRSAPPELDEALHALAPDERKLVTWHYFHGLTDAEIARLLRTSPGAVKARRSRVLSKMRKMVRIEG